MSAAQDPYSLAAIGTLLAALGLSATSGLRAYIPLLAVGLAGATGIVPLQDSFKDLASPPVLIVLGVLVVGEFIIDKIPLVDHVSDAIHTVIRPVSGAVIMAGTANSLSTLAPWVAAILGALLALVFHGAKATTRPAVSATTAGVGNPVISLVEDIVVIAAVLLLIFAPIIGVILLILVVLVFARLFLGVVRRLRGRKGDAGAGGRGGARVVPASAQVVPSTAPQGAKRPGRGRSKAAARQAALPAPVPVPVPVVLPPVAGGAAMMGRAGPAPGPAAVPVPAPAPAVPTGPASPFAPTQPATVQPPYPAGVPASPLYGGMPGAGNPLAPTQTFPQSGAGQQPGNLYPPDATTLPGTGNP
jgi:hypothetical protein